jgi:secondary thiamine-phosphate synthase enzyme
MVLFRDTIEVETKNGMSFVDITDQVVKLVYGCKIEEGICNIFLPGTTAGLMVNENDRMLMEDFMRFFRTVDEKKLYSHPSNAFSHLRANLARAELTIPVSNRKLLLGKWQNILLWEFDVDSRKRELIISVVGD